MNTRRARVLLGLLLSGCSGAAPAPEPLEPGPPAPASPAPVEGAAADPAPAAAAGPAPRTCGPLGCRLFQTPREGFDAVLVTEPRVLGVGESHALLGTEQVEPSVRRFTRDFLPALAGRASDLVVELLLPNPSCQKASAEAKKEQKVVTEKQAATNQNDYVTLGTAARSLGIRAHALAPTCEDLTRIAGAGPDAVLVSLDVIARITTELLTRFVKANEAAGDARLVVTYGGALHNDATPRAGHESWSYGPAMTALTGGRYTELDLVVPEFVKDAPAWRALPWYEPFRADPHPADVTLFAPSDGSYTLIFARGPAAAPAAGPSAAPSAP